MALAQPFGSPQEDNAKVTNALIRQDAPGTYRVMCLSCFEQFDLFGRFEPASADAESPVAQSVIEHMAQCSRHTLPRESFILKNVNSPIWKMTVRWL
jgi:hypothetical protein